MDRIIAPNSVPLAQADTAPTTGTPQYATDGNPATNTPATLWPAYAFNTIQDEIYNVIIAAGLTPDRTKWNQLLTAIQTMLQGSTTNVGVDTGAVNAYVVAFSPALTAPIPWAPFWVKIKTTNTGASTLNATGTVEPWVGAGHQPLQGGELVANGNALTYWNPTLASGSGSYVLLFCSGAAEQIGAAIASQHAVQLGQVQGMPGSIQSIGASVASNALTLAWQPQPLVFRNATLTSGAPITAAAPASPLSLTVPSGATLGTVSGQAATLVLLVAYNGGSPVLCIANLAGGLVLDETNLISPTTIGSGATSASTIYSAAAVSANSPYRVVGMVQISETTAGTWATAPTLVQGTGGQALASISSLGYEQTWQNVIASRALGTTYYNTTGRPILVSASIIGAVSSSCIVGLTVNGVTASSNGAGGIANAASVPGVNAIVPPGGSYSVSANSGSLNSWAELR